MMYQASVGHTEKDLERIRRITEQLQESDHLFTVQDCKDVWFYVYQFQENGDTKTIAFGFEKEKEKPPTLIVGLIKPGILTQAQVILYLDDNYRRVQDIQ